MNHRMIQRNLALGVSALLVLAYGCSAGEGGGGRSGASESTEQPSETGGSGSGSGSGSSLGGRPGAPVTGTDDEEGDPHPLFGAGDYSGVDLSDPCNTLPIWEPNTEVDVDTGGLVIYDGKQWQLVGDLNGTWALEQCTPPGEDWCTWEEVGTCPAN